MTTPNDPPAPRPRLLVVTGRPGSGKTTLAHRLAGRIFCPALCRDELKEGWCHTLNQPHAALPPGANLRIFDAFREAMALFLRHGITLVAEAAFQHKLWQPALEPLAASADIRIIVCQVDAALARERLVVRGLAEPRREQCHREMVGTAAGEPVVPPLSDYDPPRLPFPTLTVDTTADYRPPLDEVLAFAIADRTP